MKKTFKWLALALVCFMAGIAFLAYSSYTGRTAEAIEKSSSLQFESADEAYKAIQNRFYCDWKSVADLDVCVRVTDKRTDILYRLKHYGEILAKISPDSVSENNSSDFKFIVANSEYRNGVLADSLPQTAEAIARAITLYENVIRADERNFDVAFNYEFLLRVQENLRKKPKDPQGSKKEKSDSRQQPENKPHGQEGYQPAPNPAELKEAMQVLIPTDKDSDDKDSKTPLRKKKG